MRRRTVTVRATCLAAALATAAAVWPAASPAEPVAGELRVLYVLATWGPLPFSTADAQTVAAETDAFFRASSSGRLSMPGTVASTPLTLPRAVFDNCDATALRDASPASTFAGFDRIAFVTPPVATCGFAGEANPTEVLLNGQLFRSLAGHELGHTLGLGHASRWRCSSCALEEYGNAFSVMGGGDGDLNAWEKSRLEWLTGTVRARAAGTYELGPVERPTSLPQVLVIATAGTEFWLESRGVPTPSFTGATVQPPGIVVTARPSDDGEPSPFVRPNLLLANPAGGNRYAYAAGEAFVRPGIFRLTVSSHEPTQALLRFEWLDRIRPGRPGLDARAAGRGRVRLSWAPARERGSGVATYTVRADGRRVAVLDQQPLAGWGTTIRLTRGRHTVGVFATDRAGNRGLVASRRVRVR
jgi:hypothetical protein